MLKRIALIGIFANKKPMNTTNQAGHKDGLKSPMVNLIGFKNEFPVIEL